jgi:hypothetical protein
MDIGYDFGQGLKTELGIFNLLDSKGKAAEYFRTDRLPEKPRGESPISDFHSAGAVRVPRYREQKFSSDAALWPDAVKGRR